MKVYSICFSLEKVIYKNRIKEMIFDHKFGFYEKYVKRILDIICSFVVITVFGWLFIIIALLVRLKMGTPVVFSQPRPGMIDIKTGKEKIFYMYKFRTMSDERNKNGELLPDNMRLTSFGAWLRRTSLDELLEMFNILKGDMSIIGPRPQLVRDMVFMSNEQRKRHIVKPGLSGLAQIKGRNAITWEEKINWDLKYIEHITFIGDLKIFFGTVVTVFKRNGITDGENATALDYGDTLLKLGRINRKEYDDMQAYARELVIEHKKGNS